MARTYDQVHEDIRTFATANDQLFRQVNEHIQLRRTLLDRKRRIELKREVDQFAADEWNEKAAAWRSEKKRLTDEIRAITLQKIRSEVRKARTAQGHIDTARQQELLEEVYESLRKLKNALNKLRPLGLKVITY